MRVLPYVGLSAATGIVTKTLPVEEVDENLRELCYLVEHEGEYKYQIGYGINDSSTICTSKDLIHQVHDQFVRELPELDPLFAEDLRVHIDLYCQAFNILPAWGLDEYYALHAQGKTPRRLDGPHREGQLSAHHSRFVIPQGENLVYGPTINYLHTLSKVRGEDVKTV